MRLYVALLSWRQEAELGLDATVRETQALSVSARDWIFSLPQPGT